MQRLFLWERTFLGGVERIGVLYWDLGEKMIYIRGIHEGIQEMKDNHEDSSPLVRREITSEV